MSRWRALISGAAFGFAWAANGCASGATPDDLGQGNVPARNVGKADGGSSGQGNGGQGGGGSGTTLPPASGSPGDDAGGSAPPPGNDGGYAPPPTGDDGGGGTPPAGPCGSSTTADACYQCCEAAHTTGADAYYGALASCLCTSPGTCKTQCASTEVCAQQGTAVQPGDACDTCIQGASACGQAADTACQSEPDCVAMIDCSTTSQCDAKGGTP